MIRTQPAPHGHRQRQQGAAALIVVMVLFFIVSMVAAYTSRNLIFEQRTASNQYRSTQALEAADAGIEWALAHLNAGRITNACMPSTDDAAASHKSFRQRYLDINQSTGAIDFVAASGGGSVVPRCVFDGTATDPQAWKWSCSCPAPDAASSVVTSPSAASYIIGMRRNGTPNITARTDLFYLQANSCTRLSNDCLSTSAVGGTGDGVAAVRVLVALRGAITRVPAGALTVAGTLAALPTGATLSVTNTDEAANGVTIHTSSSIPAGVDLVGLPGTVGQNTVVPDDAGLTPAAQPAFTAPQRRFAAFFGMLPTTYARQPGMVQLDCSGGCDAAAINVAMLRNPGRAVWLTGTAGTVTLDADVGTVGQPALLIVDGDVAFGDGVTFTGLLYGRKPNWAWNVTGTATLVGAAIAEDGMQLLGAGSTTRITYSAAILKALRVAYGTFVRVPGSWKDFS